MKNVRRKEESTAITPVTVTIQFFYTLQGENVYGPGKGVGQLA